MPRRSAIVDTNEYRQWCANSASDGGFPEFRSTSVCLRVVDTVRPSDGLANLWAALLEAPGYVLPRLSAFARNDRIGFPARGIMGMSPTTMRYVRVAAQLYRRYGSLDGWQIAEIGGGYGGQARILSVGQTPQITIYDLPEAVALTRRYLSQFGIEASYVTFEDIVSAKYDLVISNYAFSELAEDMQLEYIDKIVASARHGFMLCNAIASRFDIHNLTPRATAKLLHQQTEIEPSLVGTDKGGIQLLSW